MKHHLFKLISSAAALVLTLRFFSMSPASGPEPVKSGGVSQSPVTVSSVLEEIDSSAASSSDYVGPSDLSPVPDDENALDDPVSSSVGEKPGNETEEKALSAHENSSNPVPSDTASSPASGASSSLKSTEKKASTTPESVSKKKEETAKVSERNKSNTASVSIVSTAKPAASESTSLSSSTEPTEPSSPSVSSAASSGSSKNGVSSSAPVSESVPSGHYETVTVTPAWDETVTDSAAWDEPVYTTEWHYYCASCGMDLTAAFGDKVFSDGSHGKSAGACQHIESHYGTSDQVGDYTAPVTVQTDTIHHEAVTHIVHHEAVTEQVWVTQ